MTDQTSVADELAPPSQPHRLSTSCDVHPNERFSGFCPSCLCERLSVLDAPLQPLSSSRKPPNISAASLKALFKPSSSNNNNNNHGNVRVKSSFFPELRRSKSFSAKNNEGFSGGIEPQRRSCDVRLRDEHRNVPDATVVVSGGKIEDDARKSSVSETVFEVNEEEEEAEIEEEEVENDSGEIVQEKTGEIVEEEEESKPIKDYIDLYPQTKKLSLKDFAGGFRSAAKKLQKWRQKQKSKKLRSNDDEGGKPHFPVKNKPFRDTQSEIGDYGFGRRSSDTDPRFSLDAGRFSVDINRISLDEPRASWDGHLIGGKTPLPPAIRVPPPPSMLSVVENAPVNQSELPSPSINPINRESDSDPIIIIPGGSNQTREYYNTEPPSSSSRRRKSLDRSNSIRKIITELDEVKSASNSKVSPTMIPTDLNSRIMRDDYSIETAENRRNQIGGDKKSRRCGKTVATELDEVKSVSNSKVSPAITIDSNSMETDSAAANKKSRRWAKWSMLGFIYRKGANKDEEEDRYSRSNSTGMVEERSISESWPELRNGGPQMRRSNSNVSWRSSGGGGGGSKRNSKRYSSSKDGENGMLRFYLTPIRSNWRNGGSNGGGGGGGGWEKTAARANSHGHSIARRVMRLY